MPSLAPLGDAVQKWFPIAFMTGGDPLPDRAQFWHGVAGLVTLADWIASDETIFPLLPLFEGGDPILRMAASRMRARAVLRQIGFDPRDSRAASVAHHGFQAISAHPPRPVQEATEVWSAQDRIVVLESETGSGKTEAALARFARLFSAGEVDGLYFALPTRVAASSLHARVVIAVERMFPDAATRPKVILAIPGVAPAENEGAASIMAPASGVDVWEPAANEQKDHGAWAADRPKKFLAGTIAIGTIDQALLGVIAVKHAHLRLASLMRHRLVVDEVHASDRYMSGLLSALLRFHAKAGGHALLLSATLGASARAALLDDDDPPSLAQCIAAPYPALSSDRHAAPVAQTWEGRAKAVALNMSHAIAAPETIAAMALEAAERGAKVLVIRNLRREAIAVFEALMQLAPNYPALFRCAGVPTLHHGRFAREDRARLDRAVEEAVGRNRPQGGLVIVGTQTLEQSLDIDADFLITDLAPADVLLQRIGRLHRHMDRAGRPLGYAEPHAVVLTPPAMDDLLGKAGAHGLGGGANPYMDLIGVEATRRLVERHPVWTIPAMNRELVERATHPEALHALTEELVASNPKWRSAEVNVWGGRFAMSQQAKDALLQTHLSFSDPAVLFKSDQDIGTRLGVRDLAVRFAQPVRGPFGGDVQHIAIPGHWAEGIDASGELSPRVDNCDWGLFEFTLQSRSFSYSRSGLQRAP
jgi:CRISPR-associated endonuclease/helicase Cas3